VGRKKTRKIHKGTTRKAAALSNSSLSGVITPILDQSPLYLKQHLYISMNQQTQPERKESTLTN